MTQTPLNHSSSSCLEKSMCMIRPVAVIFEHKNIRAIPHWDIWLGCILAHGASWMAKGLNILTVSFGGCGGVLVGDPCKTTSGICQGLPIFFWCEDKPLRFM
ncbi:uncharacterized protein MELLADRAFT_102230 [Melampsora larici-populina 98AG31]|uniref:Uncharacterized protein n=1 Tax=Melampsora larici-populina (strain 98AG31 / pathotype 3-4-7) TaxID=747676 RepID=F4R7M0_MELLP|nr:uncharacterized protein MELLADRAFT_102230 [Melampsora larici-populina 98AG31]EGG11761.1 hypothetical protein MELLADRAFT_102230 [Melampsora larici-populina 98AG31]